LRRWPLVAFAQRGDYLASCCGRTPRTTPVNQRVVYAVRLSTLDRGGGQQNRPTAPWRLNPGL